MEQRGTQTNVMTKSFVFGVVLTFIDAVLGLYHNSDGWIQETACYGSDHRCSKFKLSCAAENRIILGQMQYAFKFLDECVFGVSDCDQNPMMCCKYSEGDRLLSYWENDTYVARRMCSAKQSCSLHVPWIGTGLVISSYVRLNYRCAPEKSIVDMCSSVITHAKDLYLMFNGTAESAQNETIRRNNCRCKISTTNCLSSLRISYTDMRVLRVNKDMPGKRCSSASLVTSSFKTIVDCDPGNLPMREPTDADVLNSYQETLTLQNLWKYGENDVPEFLLLSVTAENYESEVNVVCNMPESIHEKFDSCRPNKIHEASKRGKDSENPSQTGDGKGYLNIKQESRKSTMVDKIGRFKATQRRRAGVVGQSESHGGDRKTSMLLTDVRSGKHFHLKTPKLPNSSPSGQAHEQFYPISDNEFLENQRELDEIPNKSERKGMHDSTLYSTSDWRYSTHFAMPKKTFIFEPSMQKRETGQHSGIGSGSHVGTMYVDKEKDTNSKMRENENNATLKYTSISTFHSPDSGQQEIKFPNIQEATPKPLSPNTLRQIVKNTKLEYSWPALSFSSRSSSAELNKEKYEGRVTVFGRKRDYNTYNPKSDSHNAEMLITSNTTNREQSFNGHVTDSSKPFVSPVTHKSNLSGMENLNVSSMKNNVKTVNMTREEKSNVGGISMVDTHVKKENSSFQNASELTAENSNEKESSIDVIKVIAVTDGNKSVQDETLSVFSSLFAPNSSVHVEMKADEIQKHNDGLQELATRELGAADFFTKEMLSDLSSTKSSISVVRHSKDKMIFNRDGNSSKINAYTTNDEAIENNRTSESKIPCSLTTEYFRQDNEKFQLTLTDLSRDKIKKEKKLFPGDASRNFIFSRLSSSSFPSSWTSPIYSSKIEFRDSKETVTMLNWRTKEMIQSNIRAWGKRTAILQDQTSFHDDVKEREMSKLIDMNDPIVQQMVSNKKLYHDHPLQRKMKTQTAITIETSLTTLAGDKSEFIGNTRSPAEQIRRESTVVDDEMKTNVTRSSALFSSTTEPFDLNENVTRNTSRPSMTKTSLDTSAVGTSDGKDALAVNSTWEMTSVGNTKYIIKESNAENTLGHVSSTFLTSDSMSTISSTDECTFGMSLRSNDSSSCRSSYLHPKLQTNDSNKFVNYVEKNSDNKGPANESFSEDASDYLKQVPTAFTAGQQTKMENKIGLIWLSTPYRRLFVADNSTVLEAKSERPESDVSDTLHPIHEHAPIVKIATDIPTNENLRNSLSDNEKLFRDLNQEDTNSPLIRDAPEDQIPNDYQGHTPRDQSLIDEGPRTEVKPVINNQSSSKERFLTNTNCTKALSAPVTRKMPLGQEKISTSLIEASSLHISARKVPQKSDTAEWMWTSLSFIRETGSNRRSSNLSHIIFSNNDDIKSRSQHEGEHSLQSTGASSIKPNKVTIKENETADNSILNVLAADNKPHIKLVQYPFHTEDEVNSLGRGTRFPSTFNLTFKTEMPNMQTSNKDSLFLDIRASASFHENKSLIVTEQREQDPQKSTSKANLILNTKNYLATKQSSAKEPNTRGPKFVDFAIRNLSADVEKKVSNVNEGTTEQIVKAKAKNDIFQGQSDLPSNVSSNVSVSNDDAKNKGIEVPPSVGLEKISASTERKQPVTNIMRTERMDVNNEQLNRTKESEYAETPNILNENDAKIIVTEGENAKLIGKMETSKIKTEDEEELDIGKTDFNVNTKEEGSRQVVTSVICGALILLALVGFIVLIYIRLNKVKLDERQWNSLSISAIEKSDRPYNCYGHSRTASWSTVNNSQACFSARLSTPSRHIVSPHRNLNAMNHPPILVQGKWPDMVTTPFDKRPEVADKDAYKSRAAILLPNETTRPSAPYSSTSRAGIYKIV
ncbi:hypothetical protein CHS0354_033707 [Potamilus streckersoni]|uniref:Uncharacterized protein n=1 Tax=Potamilus streckersoni TaxID=2493646 RepID=A0AAE0S2D4_9BIVA|nr:hypothetical protein CHS0354_033707 [Potamilus streckersoni]